MNQRYFYLGDNRGLAIMHDGHRIYVDPRDRGLAPHIIANGVWEAHIEGAIRGSIYAGNRVIEVGCNVGYHTLHMAAAVGKTGTMHVFEANPHIAKYLSDSIEINGYRDRVTVWNKIAWSDGGEAVLVVDPEWCGGAYVVEKDEAHAVHTETHLLERVRLDDVVDGADFIRIDAEGSEMHILAGARNILRNSPNVRICLEWSVSMMSRLSDVRASLDELRSDAFRFHWINPDSSLTPVGIDDLMRLPHGEVYMCRY